MKIFSALIVICLLNSTIISAQEPNVIHSIYFIGNTTGFPEDKSWEAFSTFIRATKENFTMVHTGDISDKKDTEKHRHSVENLTRILQGVPNGKIYFIPGDKDWANSKKNGYEAVTSLEKELEKVLPGAFIPSSGCPGPKVIDISSNIRLVAINSQWWIHPYDKPGTHHDECKCRTEQELIDKLAEIINESEDKNILIVGHHPVISYGTYGGHIPLKRHLFPFPGSWIPAPVFGSIYSAYRQNSGTVRDMAHPTYQSFIKGMNKIFEKNTGLIYASSHEYNQQLNLSQGNYHIISGSISRSESLGNGEDQLFASSAKGFSKIEYLSDGSIRSKFYKLKSGAVTEIYSRVLFQSPCAPLISTDIPVNNAFACAPEVQKPSPRTTSATSITIPASTKYKAGIGKRLLLGTLYRKIWLQPVTVSYLYMDTAKGGLKVYGKGGGRQTLSLKLEAGNGQEYVFRSIDKDFTRALLPLKFKNTVFERMLKDITATQHPYGAMPAAKMLNHTDIFHSDPELYVLPDDPALGRYRSEFAGMFGILEERPFKNDNGKKYKEADKISQSVDMIGDLYENHDNRISVENFGKSRVFDMLIGDWGRHEDNYKWLGYKQDGASIFYPFPRDRDQAFTRWNGLLPSIADGFWALPFVEAFDDKFHNLKSLNYNARHIDRLLLNSLNREDWKRLSSYITEKINDSIIEKSVLAMPPEVQTSRDEIEYKLKKRRQHLSEAVDEYYRILAEKVDVVGSNQNEYFEAEKLPNGNVMVKMWAKGSTDLPEGSPLFQREFIHKETKEICLFGLGGEDVFILKGSTHKTILIRIIGGEGNDKIIDNAETGTFTKKTRIYDNLNTGLSLGRGSRNNTSDKFNINHYDRRDFKYNTFIPSFGVFYRKDDGFGLTLAESYTSHGFRTDKYKTRYDIAITASTNKNLYLHTHIDRRHLVEKWDLVFDGTAGNFYPNFNFFGLGNNTRKNEELFDEDFYRLRTYGFTGGVFAERKFFKLAYFHAGPVVEQIKIKSDGASLLSFDDDANGHLYGGIESALNLDLRDKKNAPTKGIRLSGKFTPYHDLSAVSDFIVSEAFIEYYANLKILLPIVLAAEVGGSKVTGSDIPLNKYAFLGQKNHLRGFVRHRFTGDQSAYLNTEVRVNLGKSENQFIPFYFGIFGFKDYGKVWLDGVSGNWHSSEGGGFFIAPITTSLTLRCSVEHSAEENFLLDIGAGFYLDK